MQQELKDSVVKYLNSMERGDLQQNYNELISIVMEYKAKGITKEQVLHALNLVMREHELDDYQDEVLIDVGNRISGFCSPDVRINW